MLAGAALGAEAERNVFFDPAFPVAYDEVVSSKVAHPDVAGQGHDDSRGLFLEAFLRGGQPAWCLGLDYLRVVGGDAVGNFLQAEVVWDVVEEEAAVGLSDLDVIVGFEVGEGVCDDLDVVFVDDTVAGVVSGEDDGGTVVGQAGADEGWDGDVFVVDQRGVDAEEGGVGDCLTVFG